MGRPVGPVGPWARGPAELRPVGRMLSSRHCTESSRGRGGAILGGAMSALSTSSQASKNSKREAKAARDKEKDGQASTVAKKRAQLRSTVAKIEKMVYSLTQTQKQHEQYWRERRYACLRDEAAEDLQVHTITKPANTTSA